MGSALSFPRIVSSLAKCFYKICRIFGKTFVDKKVSCKTSKYSDSIYCCNYPKIIELQLPHKLMNISHS